jgi:membrane protease YdiL (CAAX protease family)
VLAFALVGPDLDSASLADVSRYGEVFGPVGGYLVINASFPFFLLGILLAVVLIHRRHPRTLVTAGERVSWRRVGQGFVAWLVPWVLVIGGVQFLLYPSSFSMRENLSALAYFVPLALLFTGIQVTAEELFFRGYLVQGASLVSANRVFLALAAAALFTVPHLLNPEATEGGFLTIFLNYFVAGGLVWVVASLVDGTTELAIGAHLANNLGNALLLGVAGASLPSPSLFFVDRLHTTFYSLSVLVIVPIFFLAAFVLFRRKATRASGSPSGEPQQEGQGA